MPCRSGGNKPCKIECILLYIAFVLWIHASEPDAGAFYIVDMPLLLGLTLNCELVCLYGRVLKTGMCKHASFKNLDDDTDRREGIFFPPSFDMWGVVGSIFGCISRF